MSGTSELIAKLAGKLIGELGNKARGGTMKGSVPNALKKRMQSYSMFRNIWSNADHDIVLLVAMADEMWENSISPIRSKDENALQVDFGVNAVSRSATKQALARMEQERKALRTMKQTCEAMRPLAQTLAARSLLGGPANASQIKFDRMGAAEVDKRCRRNETALDAILPRFDAIIEVNEDVRDVQRAL